jgi:hypothetical protein
VVNATGHGNPLTYKPDPTHQHYIEEGGKHYYESCQARFADRSGLVQLTNGYSICTNWANTTGDPSPSVKLCRLLGHLDKTIKRLTASDKVLVGAHLK